MHIRIRCFNAYRNFSLWKKDASAPIRIAIKSRFSVFFFLDNVKTAHDLAEVIE